jgi:hypothetical protein
MVTAFTEIIAACLTIIRDSITIAVFNFKASWPTNALFIET